MTGFFIHMVTSHLYNICPAYWKVKSHFFVSISISAIFDKFRFLSLTIFRCSTLSVQEYAEVQIRRVKPSPYMDVKIGFIGYVE